MPAAVNGNEFHFNFRVVTPEYLLDVKSVGHLGLACFGRADDVVEGRLLLSLGIQKMPLRKSKNWTEVLKSHFGTS